MPNIKGDGSLFKRAIGYTSQQVAKIATTKKKPEKVTNMVGTFLKENNIGSLFKIAIGYISVSYQNSDY
ncbi:hypothetical protein [Emticicia sp. C21]|uniref:hypothetical protein n=1 Tax=Emticicia sp. C21 TaxID=2302915 RepID=UPI000E343147|nr:hypothetical protein [Emticicia sp. C21]RFS17269.1 hypothetical protein D0T08_05675 [Emticicia sp. C21]